MEVSRLADSYGGYRSRLVEALRANRIDDLAVLRAFGGCRVIYLFPRLCGDERMKT